MDGVYWHEKTKENDDKYNKVARRLGYVIIRITDKEIKELGKTIIERKIKAIWPEI